MAHKTWDQKMAEVRRKNAARQKAAAAKYKKSSAGNSITNDFFDVVTQLVGVTNEWTGTGKKKKK